MRQSPISSRTYTHLHIKHILISETCLRGNFANLLELLRIGVGCQIPPSPFTRTCYLLLSAHYYRTLDAPLFTEINGDNQSQKHTYGALPEQKRSERLDWMDRR